MSRHTSCKIYKFRNNNGKWGPKWLVPDGCRFWSDQFDSCEAFYMKEYDSEGRVISKYYEEGSGDDVLFYLWNGRGVS